MSDNDHVVQSDPSGLKSVMGKGENDLFPGTRVARKKSAKFRN